MTFRLRDGLSIGDQSVITYDGELIGNDFYYENTLPSVTPTLNLNFLTKKLDPRITFTRGSTATYYDGKTTTLAEQNLLTNSQNFSQWSTGAATITANSTTAPDGTTTAYTITDTTSTASHFIRQTYYALTDVPYTISAYLKAGTSNYALLVYWDTSTANRGFSAEFNLSTGVVSRTFTTSTSSYVSSSSITAVGNGWYRCSVTGIVSDASTSSGMGILISDGTSAGNSYGTIQYTGTGTSSIYAWGAQLEQRSTVSPYIATTTSTVTNYIPVLQTAAANQPRFDHDPLTGECKGLLIEEERTNLLSYSSEMSSWPTISAFSITSNTITSPDGTQTGDLIVPTTADSLHWIRRDLTASTTTTYTYSAYAKQGSGSYTVNLMYGAGTSGLNGGNRGSAKFNLISGTITSSGNNGVASTISSSITPVGNGWFRCSITFIPDTGGSSTTFAVGFSCADAAQATSVNFAGDGTSGIYVWGAQLEVGSFATSYIPTTSTTVIRSADNALISGTNLTSWYNQTEGTIFTNWIDREQSIGRQLFSLSSNDSTNYRISTTVNASNVLDFQMTNGSTDEVSSITPSIVKGEHKMAFAYKQNDSAGTMDGAPTSTDINCTVPSVDRLTIGSRFDGLQLLNSTIKSIKYYPKRLTNAELQAITL